MFRSMAIAVTTLGIAMVTAGCGTSESSSPQTIQSASIESVLTLRQACDEIDAAVKSKQVLGLENETAIGMNDWANYLDSLAVRLTAADRIALVAASGSARFYASTLDSADLESVLAGQEASDSSIGALASKCEGAGSKALQ